MSHGTPREKHTDETLTVEIVSNGIAGKRVIWPLLTPMWARRRRGEAMVVNGNLRIRALSTEMIAGGTPMRQLILNTKALNFYRRERRVRKDFKIFFCVLSVLSGEN